MCKIEGFYRQKEGGDEGASQQQQQKEKKEKKTGLVQAIFLEVGEGKGNRKSPYHANYLTSVDQEISDELLERSVTGRG